LDTQANDEVEIDKPEESSIDDTIRDTLRDIKSRDTNESVTPDATEEPATEDKPKPAREASGKFKAKTAEEVSTESTETDAQEPIVTQDLQRLGLRKDEAAEWDKTPPKIQEAFNRRINETMAGLDQYKQAASFGQNVYKEMQPYEATFRSLGLAPEKAVGELLKNDYILRSGTPQQKQSAAQNLLKYYGIDMGSVTAEQPYVDPQVDNLQRQLSQMQNYIQNQEAQSQSAQETALNSEIAKAAQENEHFDRVKPEMAALLQAGQAKDLNEAYEKAIWINPEVRGLVLAKQQEDARKQAAEVAAKARSAASVNVSARGRLPASNSTAGATMEETIRNKFRQLTQS
jgi:hypothetical protein